MTESIAHDPDCAFEQVGSNSPRMSAYSADTVALTLLKSRYFPDAGTHPRRVDVQNACMTLRLFRSPPNSRFFLTVRSKLMILQQDERKVTLAAYERIADELHELGHTVICDNYMMDSS